MEKPASILSAVKHEEVTSTTDAAPHKQRVTGFQALFTFYLAFAAFLPTFDTTYGGTVLIMPPFKKAFGHCVIQSNGLEVCALTTAQLAIVSITTIFLGIGSLSSGPISATTGRRRSIQIGCLLTIIGAAGMLGFAGNFVAYMACKSIGALGAGNVLMVGAVYGAETAPPQVRGILMGTYGIGHGFGNLMAAVVCLASSRLKDNWAWMTPIICQIPIGTMLALNVQMSPESPRWLMTKGKEAEARAALGKFLNRAEDSDDIGAEICLIQDNLVSEKTTKESTGWLEIFQGKDLRRTAIACLVLYGNAVTGSAFVLYYGALFLADVGIKDPYLINVIIALCIFVPSLPAPVFLDFYGRRACLLTGYITMASAMLAIAVTGTVLGKQSYTGQVVCVAFLCGWAVLFGFFILPTFYIASCEMHSVRLRSYGQAFGGTIYQIFSFAAAFWSPYTLGAKYGNMGAKVGYLYFGLSLCQIALTFFFVPETGAITLEQIDSYFASGEPAWKTNLKKNKAIARQGYADSSGE